MEPQLPTTEPPLPVVVKKNSYWRKLGGGSLAISILIHAVFLIIGAWWIIRIIPPPPEKVVDFMPSGGGGGSKSASERSTQKQKAAVMRPTMSRIAVQGVASQITLPEMDNNTQLSSLGSLSSGGLSGGLGGTGSGGGKGDGTGKGFGSGTGIGAGIGTGTTNPFGLLDANADALVGTFYDLKQDKDRKPSPLADADRNKIGEVLNDFTSNGWKESILKKYYTAPQKLYQTKVYIPLMPADAAPAAFDCEKEVQPSRWVVVYRGTVVAPKSGKFRFVGGGDDSLVVRFNGATVFDHGYTITTLNTTTHGELIAKLKGQTEDRDFGKLVRRKYPTKIPVEFFEYPTIESWNSAIGGFAAGVEFSVVGGRAYPIDILISEIPGGIFGAFLLIEEIGAKYEKISNGLPILPVFRTDASLPKAGSANAAPFAPDSPIWKVQKGTGTIGF